MATTLQSLKTYYDNVMRTDFAHIPTADQALLTNLSGQVDGGTLSLAAAQGQIAKLAINTTSVASLSYNFFTGGPPTAGGLDYLVSPNGPNPTNLNSAYYQAFSVENRAINFASNLGKVGEGKAWFDANYGALSLADSLAKAYLEIFGVAADAAKINAILNDTVPNGMGGTYARQDYFASYGGDGLNGQGTKAAMVGWLMAEALKADVGTYAKANDAFIADLGTDGVAFFRSSLATAYGTPAAGTAGASLTIAADKSISPTAVDPTLKSTANNDTLTGTAGLNAAQSVDAGAGRDTISLTGTIYGRITTADGGDTLTLGALGASTPTLGVPAQYGTVALTGGGDTVTLKGGMAQGTSVTATGTGNVLHIDAGNAEIFQGTISGFQTVYYHATHGATVADASVLYGVIDNPADTGALSLNVTNQVVVLQNTPNALVVSTPTVAGGGTKVEVHLQNFKGAPTTDIAAAMGGYFVPNGGAIGFYANSSGPEDHKATLALHVDTDSTAGLIYGWGTNSVFSPSYRYALENLTITGAGKLTAQISNTFTNIDASQAGDLNLTYKVDVSSTSQTLRLGDGTNTLNLVFANASAPSSTIPGAKIYLGGGTDTIVLAKGLLPGQPEVGTLANLHIQNGTTLDAPSSLIGFQKGVDHLVLDALVHTASADVQAYADGKTSLQDALIAVSAHVAVNSVAVFAWGGDTYVYAQDGVIGVNMYDLSTGAGDGLIKLTGVTGLTVGTGAGSYDIHYG